MLRSLLIAALLVPVLPAAARAETGEEERRACLGVRIQDGSRGAEIVELFPGFPAEQSGLAIGDQILAIDGTRVRSGRALSDFIQSDRLVGDRVELRVRRGERTFFVTTVLDRFPSDAELFRRSLLNREAPPVGLEEARGQRAAFDLENVHGDVVILAFFSSYCAKPCRTLIGQLNALAEEGRGGVHVVSVSTARTARALTRYFKPGVRVLVDDGSVSKAYGAGRGPVLVVIDRDRQVRYAGLGEEASLKDATPVLEQAVRERNGIQ